MVDWVSKPRRGGTFETSPVARSGEVSLARLPAKNGRNRSSETYGTLYAIDNLALGVPADLPQRSGRGGARNRADRESHALTTAQIANLMAAERHAARIGLPLTRMITIHWEAAGVPLSGMVKATGRFTDLLGKLLARHGSRSAWIWVMENGENKGGHCHMLVHVPAELVAVLAAQQRRWLHTITGRPYRSRVIYSKPIGGRLGLERGDPELHAANVAAALSYVIKGASREAASIFGLERIEPGGLVIGRRCSASQNINRKARREAAGFAHPAHARARN
jgi:hypothetical protein